MAHKKLMGFLKFQFCQVKNLASEHTRREHGLEKKPPTGQMNFVNLSQFGPTLKNR